MEVMLTCGPEGDEKEITLALPDTVSRPALMLSGGLDSTILLYLITKYFPSTEFKFFTAKKVGEPIHAKNVLEKLGISTKNHELINVPLETYHNAIVRNIMFEKFESGEVDFIFTAVNQPPPGLGNINGFLPPERAPFNTVHKPKTSAPFRHLLKHHILDLYFREGAENLLPLTHSCTQQPVGPCEQCWFCAERRWAFDQLNKNYIPSA